MHVQHDKEDSLAKCTLKPYAFQFVGLPQKHRTREIPIMLTLAEILKSHFYYFW